jgi:Cu(I)/Ag(I) efflux system membrane protein CusA/SilA
VFQYAVVDDTASVRSRAEKRAGLVPEVCARVGRRVAEIASIGGFVKQYQVNLDRSAWRAYDMSVKDVVSAIRHEQQRRGRAPAGVLGREYMVRGRGYLKSLADIEKISLVSIVAGTPVRVADVGDVRIGPDLRRGVAELDGRGEVVGGIVVMRFGENALKVIDRVTAKLAAVQSSLPSGVRIVPLYDRLNAHS